MYKFKIVKLKNFILPFILVFFTICLVVFSNSNLKAAKNGLVLWANSVVPSLFPFFVATELLSYTNFTYYLGKLLNKFMKPLFNIRGEGSFAFIMGILSGYPMGAKIAANFRQNNICSKVECERLLSFTNNSGPLFIIGSVGISLFGNSTIGFLLLFTHLLASISVGFLFRFWKKNDSKNFISSSSNIKNKTIKLSSLGEIIGNSIKSSINTILMIGGFVVIFSVVISILNQSGILSGISLMLSPILRSVGLPAELIKPVLAGIVELTNGVSLVANTHIKAISVNIVSSSFLLGFGGISVLLQVFSIISKAGLSIKTYAIGKLLQGIFAAIYTYIAICIVPFLQFNLPI